MSNLLAPSIMFLTLPVEIQEMIGAACRDQDLANLMATCSQAFDTFAMIRAGMWKRRFAGKFDIAYHNTTAGGSYYVKYTARHRKNNDLGVGVHGPNLSWDLPTTILTELINECYFHGPYFESKNLSYLREATASGSALDVVCRPGIGDTWAILQLVLLHLVLEASRPALAYCFEDACVCAYGNPLTTPIFQFGSQSPRFNIPNIMGIFNFFKIFAKYPDNKLRDELEELPAIQRPQPWHRPFGVDGQVEKVGMLWRAAIGTTAEELVEALRLDDGSPLQLDETEWITGEDDLPQLFLSFNEDLLPHDEFPNTILTYLNPYSISPPLGREELGVDLLAGRDYAMFVGTLRMYGNTQLVVGVVTPVKGEAGIQGFQRLVMVAYEDPASGSTVNSKLAGYLADELPDGKDPDDNGATECARYGAPAQSAEGKKRRAAGHRGEEQGHRENAAIIERSNEYRAQHRTLLETHRAGGEATRYYADREYRRPQLQSDLDHGQPFGEELYAYEGLVLPGGNAILGRWWDLEEDYDRAACPPDLVESPAKWRLCTGPVLFWNVDLGLSYRFGEQR